MINILRLKTSDPHKYLLVKQSAISSDFFIGIEDHNIFEVIEMTSDIKSAQDIIKILSEALKTTH